MELLDLSSFYDQDLALWGDLCYISHMTRIIRHAIQVSLRLYAMSIIVGVCLLSNLGCSRLTTAESGLLVDSGELFQGLVRKPRHDKNWRPDLMVLPYARIDEDRVHLFNIRDCEYRAEEDYDVRHFDRQVMLDSVKTIDFIVVPFKEAPTIAHTMLSFGLADGEHIVFSVEARLEQGENYSALPGATKEYELMWVVGTEEDLIKLRTEVRDVDVYLYAIKATPEQASNAFLACVARCNEIAREPEFYDLLTNNCTTNIVDMVNSLRPGYIAPDIRVVLPGHSDRLAYELGLLRAEGPFEQIRANSKINAVARLNSDAPDFSAAIRGRAIAGSSASQ